MRIPIGASGVAITLALMFAPAAAQEPGELAAEIPNWITLSNGRAAVEADVLTVLSGTIRSERLYSNFVLQFEFRLTEPGAEGRVFVRSRFGYTSPSSELGYRIELTSERDGRNALGRVSGAGVDLSEIEFVPARPSALDDGWQAVEVRAVGGRLTVVVNGSVASVAESRDEMVGYVALQARRGDGIEFRRIRAARLPLAREPFGQGAVLTSTPGVEMPRLVRDVAPWYPQEPHDDGIRGTVRLEAVVETTGRVGEIRVIDSPHPDLTEAAVGAARQWEFVPAATAEGAVPMIVRLELEFRLSGR